MLGNLRKGSDGSSRVAITNSVFFTTHRECSKCRADYDWKNVPVKGRVEFREHVREYSLAEFLTALEDSQSAVNVYDPSQTYHSTMYVCENGVHRLTLAELLQCRVHSISKLTIPTAPKKPTTQEDLMLEDEYR